METTEVSCSQCESQKELEKSFRELPVAGEGKPCLGLAQAQSGSKWLGEGRTPDNAHTSRSGMGYARDRCA
jgi:hypothetical protein